MPQDEVPVLRTRQRLGKYRIDRRLGEGGFGHVYRAYDTVEGIKVALKVPHAYQATPRILEDFRREVRLSASLDHPNILPIKYAGFVEDHFVIVYPAGERTLADRLRSRLSLKAALGYGGQMLEALAHAHARHVIHCDVKPENFILFGGDRLRLTDFGIAKLARGTLTASGSGTVGYLSPEQALGKPSFRSDVFSAGLLLYRMLSSELPEWPFAWPPPGYARLRPRVHPDLLAFLRRAMEVDQRKRFADATQMLAAFRRVQRHALKPAVPRRRRAQPAASAHWKVIRVQQFLRLYARRLEIRGRCGRCAGPLGERMQACPWCGAEQRSYRGPSRYPRRCPRCRRGVKLDWRFCSWCYGSAIGPVAAQAYRDARYVARCGNRACRRRVQMPFMRYCPWCHRKPRRAWPIEGSTHRCPRCRWGVLPDFWAFCPWCARALREA